MNNRPYIAFYNGKQITFEASSLYAAKLKAIELLNVPKKKQHMISVLLTDIEHDTASIG